MNGRVSSDDPPWPVGSLLCPQSGTSRDQGSQWHPSAFVLTQEESCHQLFQDQRRVFHPSSEDR